MGFFSDLKRKKREKELDELTRQIYSDSGVSDREMIESLKEAGLSLEQTTSAMRYFNGGSPESLTGITQAQLEASQKKMIESLRQSLIYSKRAQITQTETLPDVLAEDILRFITGMSFMCDKGFKQYICLRYNDVFAQTRNITPSDIDKTAASEGLDKLYYERDGKLFRSSSYIKILDDFSSAVPYGLKCILNNYNTFGKAKFGDLYALIFSIYQATWSVFSSLCENYENVYKDFYVMLNNCLLTVVNNVPEGLVDRGLKLTLTSANENMKKYNQ